MPGRLLLASYSYPPIADVGSIRTIKFAKYLVRMGWAVRVVSVRNPDVWRMIGDAEEPPGVEVTRTWDPIRLDRFGAAIRKVIVSRGDAGLERRAGLGGRGVVVPDFQAGWILSAAGKAARLARRWGATHLMGTGPPYSSLIVGAIAQRRTGLPFLADFQDSWTIHPDTRYPTRVHRTIDQDLERLTWERAAKVTVMTRTVAARYGERFPERRADTEVLYSGFDPEDLPRTVPRKEGPFTIANVGSFYPNSPPTTLLAALAQLCETGRASADRLQVVFVGRPEPPIQREIQRRRLSEIIQVQGFRPLREAVETAFRADLLYLLLPVREALPDKLFVYLATGNPILAEVPESECETFLQEWGDRVSFIRPGDVNRMADEIAAWMEKGHPAPMASSRLTAFREAFSREKQAHRLSEILEGIG